MIVNRNKENLLRTIVRMKKAKSRKPRVKNPELKVDDKPSQDYVEGTLEHQSYNGKTEEVREALTKILKNGSV